MSDANKDLEQLGAVAQAVAVEMNKPEMFGVNISCDKKKEMILAALHRAQEMEREKHEKWLKYVQHLPRCKTWKAELSRGAGGGPLHQECTCGLLALVDLVPKERVCEWWVDEDGNWESGCGSVFIFNDGGPKENGFKCCNRCGGKIQVKEDL